MRYWKLARRGTAEPAGDEPEPRARLHLVHGETYANWEAIYLHNVDRIYRLMFSKVGNRPDAEDLTAEVFLTALRPLRVSATVGEVRAYLLATARTVLAAHWRRTLGREITSIDLELLADNDPAPDAESGGAAGTGGSQRRAERLLAALPERYRRVLELRFLHSYTIKQTAAELGLSVGNVKVLQHRALRRAAELDRADPPAQAPQG
ncbi:RNA polymerase sigma factor [Actinomadura decatromicini]|uniref:RNA polymerase sigma factor n=1 Tax=Actinomadura decatromicini TaxID=2604572 RepID=A0A5D3FTX0_9ACTN|nr:RNA polymerase sigma factor [Actinomadura decatromicini]TYK51316.1 RNA polymerase sigma factor [Actinomadura decatromicini]